MNLYGPDDVTVPKNDLKFKNVKKYKKIKI